MLATLWSVQDEGTARLMEEFYRARGEERKTTKAAALRWLACCRVSEGRQLKD